MADFDVSLVPKLSQLSLMLVDIWRKSTKSKMLRAFNVTCALPPSKSRDTIMTICLKGMKSHKKMLKKLLLEKVRASTWTNQVIYHNVNLSFTTVQCGNWEKQTLTWMQKKTFRKYQRKCYSSKLYAFHNCCSKCFSKIKKYFKCKSIFNQGVWK